MELERDLYPHIRILKAGKVNLGVVDAQWGSGGKGKMNDWLAKHQHIDIAISQNSAQASHTVVDNDGQSFKYRVMPVSSMYCDNVIIGSGAIIELDSLLEEIEMVSKFNPSLNIMISPYASVINDSDAAVERKTSFKIASTMTGTSSAYSRKISRNDDSSIALYHKELIPYIKHNLQEYILENLSKDKTIIMETGQGYDLSLDHSDFYPYTTYRNCDPLSLYSNLGISHKHIGSVILNFRPYPIRVGDGSNNKTEGKSGMSLDGSNSGGYYKDQKEIDWKELAYLSGSSENLEEKTSLTKRVRRVFTFSDTQFNKVCHRVEPTHITINFANHFDSNIKGISSNQADMSLAMVKSLKQKSLYSFLNKIKEMSGITPCLIGTGPKTDDMLYMNRLKQ